MSVHRNAFILAAAILPMTMPAGAQTIAQRTADVGGVKLQYLTAGHGPAVLLLHGYAETSRMANQTGSENIGSSLLAGVSTKVLFGDPSKPGFYTIVLSVPANTKIAAHSHRDDRVATVVSGRWSFGYGDRFDEQALKTLPPGSVYSEPAGVSHFAQTGADPVLVQISGEGPTDTHYVNPDDEPKRAKR